MTRQLTRTLLAGVALLVLSSLLLSLAKRAAVTAPALAAESSNTVTRPDTETRMRVSEAYGKLPLSFEENRGQADRQVKFLSRGPNYALLLSPAEAVLSLQSEKPGDANPEDANTRKPETQSAVLRMKLVGSNQSPEISGHDQLNGKTNYLVGDQANWHTNIPNYAKVKYDEVYPGIDLVYYGNQHRLEYDFIVAPGVDANAIRLNFVGADEMNVEADGSLRLKLKGGEVTQPAPVIYQENESGERQTLAGHYALKGSEVTFDIADYDHSRELVIDPQLLYATFYGGSGNDVGEDIAVDGSGNAYITGTTSSPDLLLRSAVDGALSGNEDAFIVKLNPAGTDIFYATYLGSSSEDSAESIAVTSDGKACVTGITINSNNNSDFPTTSNRFQGNGFGLFSRGGDVFVTVLTPSGNGLFYSTFFGGNGTEGGNGIAVDAANNVYVAGETFSEDLPTKNAFQRNRAGTGSGRDAFVAKFNPALSGNNSLIYSSFLGGSNGNIAGDFAKDIAVTPAGVAFIVGATDSSNFPTESPSQLPPFQTVHHGVNDAFIAKVSPSGSLIYATLFGGNGEDQALSVAVDADERAYVTGFTLSNAATFPLKNAFQPNRIGSSQDAFVAKFNADGTALFYSSFLGGGNTNNTASGIAVDAGGNVYVTGQSVIFNGALTVNGFPASVPSLGGLVAKIEASDATGTTVPKILYMDGFITNGNAIAVDSRGNVYIAGANSGSMPTTPGVFQPTGNLGTNDATVVKIASTFPDTIGVFHPPSSARPIDDFRLRNSNTAGLPDLTEDFGQPGDQALAGDWNGDGVDDIGVYRPSTAQFLLRQLIRVPPTNILVPITITMTFGFTGDKAFVGDWNGDGIDTPGVFRSNQWFLTNGPNTGNTTPPADMTFNFGSAGDLPVAGDWNGDGIDSVGVYRNGVVEMTNSNTLSIPPIDLHFNFGNAGFLPVAGDWNGDGVDTLGVVDNQGAQNPGKTTFFLSNANVTSAGDIAFLFGVPGDLPVAGDWDGKPANTPPDSGVNNPVEGSSGVGQTQVFTTTCSDPDGWHDIGSIDFKIATSRGADRDGDDGGDPGRAKDDWRDREDEKENQEHDGPRTALWVRFDENRNVIRLYDSDLRVWREGALGSNIVLENRFVRLFLSGAVVQGTGPLGPAVKITWPVQFKEAAKGKYKQFLKITDDVGSSTGFDRVGSWRVKP